MRDHDELRDLLDKLNGMKRGEAAAIVTEILRYLMDRCNPNEREKE